MNPFAGKSPTERNKLIAALVLGVLAVFALGYSIIGNPFSNKKKITVSASPTPSPKNAPGATTETAAMPSEDVMNTTYTTTPVEYDPNRFSAPDAGRNIFAFYEPPPPTPYVTPVTPTPTIEIPKPATPAPTPPQFIGFATPQSVYAGSKSFRLEVNGDKYTPDSVIVLNGNQLPTTYISPQKLVADVPSNFIANAGQISIITRSADGKLFSNSFSLNVQAPPTPQFQYVGMIARQKFNNDTAYFQDQGKPTPFGARLNDVVGGRFRLTSISASEVVFEDVNLGFKHRVALFRPANGQTAGGATNNPNQNPAFNNQGNFPPNRGYNPNNPNNPNVPTNLQPGEIPGIPGNVQIYTPQQPPNPKDVDDDGNN